jgi:prevent-host-death family protein
VKQVTIHEAKTHLSRLIRQVLDGEEIVIAKRNKPVVKLHPIKSGKPERRMGWMKGKIWMAPDFDEPLEDFAEHMTTAQEEVREVSVQLLLGNRAQCRGPANIREDQAGKAGRASEEARRGDFHVGGR